MPGSALGPRVLSGKGENGRPNLGCMGKGAVASGGLMGTLIMRKVVGKATFN